MGIASLFASHTFRTQQGSPLSYRLLSPPPRQTGLVPLVVLLHGAGERGDDNAAQLRNGAAELLGNELPRRSFPCYFALPQCPPDARWVEVDWSAKSHTLPVAPSRPLMALQGLLTKLRAELPIDPERVYLVGLSMGGYGVWDLLCRTPSLFAAAVPICGGGDEAQADKLRGIPIWAFHGRKDAVVPVERSRRMIEAVRRLGSPPAPRYTELPDVEHDAWNSAFAEPELLPWLFAQRRKSGP